MGFHSCQCITTSYCGCSLADWRRETEVGDVRNQESLFPGSETGVNRQEWQPSLELAPSGDSWFHPRKWPSCLLRTLIIASPGICSTCHHPLAHSELSQACPLFLLPCPAVCVGVWTGGWKGKQEGMCPGSRGQSSSWFWDPGTLSNRHLPALTSCVIRGEYHVPQAALAWPRLGGQWLLLYCSHSWICKDPKGLTISPKEFSLGT